ncbi:MAG: polysaccharide biosynthesis/export family protein [Candidatus Saganbacteria bacterium]|nr:polysaccharide biosynthesis/export family protein [Candidatus Saganbacteria bacterium]
MRFISIFLIASFLVTLAPCPGIAQVITTPVYNATQAAPVAPAAAAGPSDQPSLKDTYVLGPGDLLEAHLIVKGNALVLDYSFLINPEGSIYFPNVSEVKLEGLTLKQARELLRKEIAKKYRENFTLYLMVARSKLINVYVAGQSVDTGLKNISDGYRIADLLKMVGFAKSGSDLTDYVYVKRQTGTDEFQDFKLRLRDIFLGADDKSNLLLKNGDIVTVPTIKSYVYVYGDVARSGTFGYVQGQTLSDYINIAGGPLARANLSGVTVTRQKNGKPHVFHINASRILREGHTEEDIQILPGDVINVPGNFFYFSDFASFANTVLLALTLYNTVAR